MNGFLMPEQRALALDGTAKGVTTDVACVSCRRSRPRGKWHRAGTRGKWHLIARCRAVVVVVVVVVVVCVEIEVATPLLSHEFAPVLLLLVNGMSDDVRHVVTKRAYVRDKFRLDVVVVELPHRASCQVSGALRSWESGMGECLSFRAHTRELRKLGELRNASTEACD
jgi:hypothetical protein